MRVLVLTNLYPNPFHPTRAAFNRQQFRALATEHAVEVISPISWLDERAARCKGASALPPNRRLVVDGIPVEHPRYFYPPRVLRNWYGHFFRRSARSAFDRACARFRPDIVLGSWAFPDGWAAVELAKRAKLPVVVKVHGCDILRGGAGLESDPGRLRRTVEALRRADGVVAVSRHLADKVVGLGVAAEKVHVVYSGIDSTVFHPGSPDEARARLDLPTDAPTVLFVGNLEPVKGVDVLLDASARVAKTGLKFHLRLIGLGPLKNQLEQRVRELGLEDRVRLLGALPHGQLGDWYRAVSLFVLPSRSEGVPSVLLEASACGTPFVASNVGGIPEVAQAAGGRLVPPGDPAALADAIVAAISTRAAGSVVAPSKTWDESAAELARVLESVVSRNTRPAAREVSALCS
jgi:glycosyltransferase involved in cell wall biosynthesis